MSTKKISSNVVKEHVKWTGITSFITPKPIPLNFNINILSTNISYLHRLVWRQSNQDKDYYKDYKTIKGLEYEYLPMLTLKKLGDKKLRLLSSLKNLSIHSLVIPVIWKVGRIFPILKPNKPASKRESYRPISLLSPVVKILETFCSLPLKDTFH